MPSSPGDDPRLSPDAAAPPAPAAPTFTVFDDGRTIASGSLPEVALAMCSAGLADGPRSALIFDDASGRVVDLDLAGSEDDVAARARRTSEALIRRRLGLTRTPGHDPHPARTTAALEGRDVSLLPRHWRWLDAQRGGAPATLRRLVDAARADGADDDRRRASQEAAYRFLSAVAGDLEGFEEALRALFRGDRNAFLRETDGWPPDLTEYTLALSTHAWSSPGSGDPSR